MDNIVSRHYFWAGVVLAAILARPLYKSVSEMLEVISRRRKG